MSSIKRPLQRITLGVFLFLITLVLIVWGASPWLVRVVAKEPLAEFGLILGEQSKVAINPFASKVEIRQLEVFDSTSDSLIEVEKADIDIALLKLFSNHLYFNEIKVSGVKTSFAVTGGELVIGKQYQLPETTEKPGVSEPSGTTEPTLITIKHFDMSQADINALIEQNPIRLTLNHLSLSDMSVTPDKLTLALVLDAVVNQGEVEAKLDFEQSGTTNNLDLDLALQSLPLSEFEGFLPANLKQFTGLASFDGKLNIIQQPQGLNVSSESLSVSLSQASLVDEAMSVALEALAIDLDEVYISMPDSPAEGEFPLKLKVRSIETTEHAQFSFTDHKLGSEQALSLNQLIIGPIDSGKSDSETQFSLKAKDADYLDLDLQGAIQPFAEKINGSIAGKISELSLPLVSPYLHEALGFGLKSGQIDLSLDVQVAEHQLAGESNLHIRGLEMNASDEQTQSTIKDGQAMPLNMALNMLKDDQGNIDLDIPVSGDVADPSFGLNSFFALVIKKAIMLQAKNYLINTFVPYANVVTVVMSGAEHLLKIRLEPLAFEYGEAQLSEQQKPYLTELANLLKDKPELQIKTCAVSAASDLKRESNQQIDETEMKSLRKLSEARERNLKRYLVETAGIASSRILFCEPEFDDSGEATPRIELKTD